MKVHLDTPSPADLAKAKLWLPEAVSKPLLKQVEARLEADRQQAEQVGRVICDGLMSLTPAQREAVGGFVGFFGKLSELQQKENQGS